MVEQGRPDPERQTRRRLIRKATLYTVGFLAAALAVAVAGSALVAWLLATQGLPFGRTWLVLAMLMVLIPGIALLVRGARGAGESNGS